MDPEDLLPNLSPGDLIEFERGKYRHWAMYSDVEGYVINICAEDKNKTQAKITWEKLVDVAGLNLKYRKVRVNNKIESARRKGLKARPVDEALESAKILIGSYVPYNFLSKNCEYYCTKWKYGTGFTDQVI